MLLKNICEFYKSIPIPRDETDVNYEIPYLHYGDIYKIYNVKLDLEKHYNNIIKVNEKYYNSKYQINNNDIVMNLTSENYSDLGKSIIIKNNTNQKFIAGMETHLIKIFSNKVIPEYLSNYFQSNTFSKTIQQYITGMKVFRVKPADILNIDLDLPSLCEQQHIVDIIGSIDDKIENNNNLIDKITEKSFLFHKNYLLKNQKKNINISEICNVKYGKSIPTSQINKDGLYPVYGSNGIIGYLNDFMFKEQKIAISCRGNSSGVVHLTLPNSTITSNSLYLDFIDKDYTLFIFYEFFKTGFNQFRTGSAQPQITIDNFIKLNLEIPLDIENYNLILSKYNNYIVGLKNENIKLEEMKKLYLKKFFG